MSHVVKVDVKYKSLQAVKNACAALGLEFVEGQTKYKWYNRHVGDYPMPEGWYWKEGSHHPHMLADGRRLLGTCDHVARIPGNKQAYEMGIYENTDGTYGVIYDFYANGQGLMPYIGKGKKDCDRFTEEYTLQVAMETAKQQGWSYTRQGNSLHVQVWDDATQTMGELVVGAGGVEANNFIGQGCQGPAQMMAKALGVETGTEIKPEFHEQKQMLYEGEG